MKTNEIKILSIYDNGGKSYDRITIVTNEKTGKKDGTRFFYSCIASCNTGTGFFLWDECTRGAHLGKKIKFEELTKELQNRVKNALKN